MNDVPRTDLVVHAAERERLMDETRSDRAGTEPQDQPRGLPRRRAIQVLGAAAMAPLASVADRESAVAKRHRRKHHKATHHPATRGKANSNDHPNATTTLFRDDFIHGFDATSGTGNWFYFSGGTFVGNDGTATISSHGLQVSSPVFQSTVPQDDGTHGLPGGFDHGKWLVYANRYTNGIPGFAAEVGRELSVEATVSAQTFHTDQHPFGTAVTNSEDDLRLASAALNGIDLESWMVFDIFLTNTRIYAFYERLPFGRGAALGNYAAFSFQIPLADRRPGDEHQLSTAYDRGAGTVRWIVDDKERFRVDRLGYRIDRQ
jgi:hypothetical protein